MISTSFIDISFRLLNSTILVGLITFIVVRYFMPSVKKQMALIAHSLQDLHMQEHTSELKKNESQILLDGDIKEYQALKEKVIRWQRVAAENKKKRIEIYEKTQQAIAMRRKMQEEFLVKTMAGRVLIKPVLAQVADEVNDYYTPVHNEKSVERIIDFMDTQYL